MDAHTLQDREAAQAALLDAREHIGSAKALRVIMLHIQNNPNLCLGDLYNTVTTLAASHLNAAEAAQMRGKPYMLGES